MGDSSPIYLCMNGYSCGLEIRIKILASDENKFILLIKEFGSRNFQWHTLGFNDLKNFSEIMLFLKYKYKIENEEIIVYEYFGKRLGNDYKFWKFCAPAIESGLFTLYGENQSVVKKHIEFSKGKITTVSK